MGTLAHNNSEETARLLELAQAGDREALSALFSRHRQRLRRMIQLRLDRRLQARVDASDVIQEAYVEVITRMNEYYQKPSYPLFLWLRLIVGERILKLHRHHLGTQMRDAGLEVSLYRGALPEDSSAALAAQLLGKHTSPTQAVVRAERMIRLQEALNTLDAMAEYRRGRDEDALKALKAAIDIMTDIDRVDIPELSLTSSFFQAMCLYRMGRAEEARQLAKETALKMKFLTNKGQIAMNNWLFHEDLIVRLTCREANALIGFAE